MATAIPTVISVTVTSVNAGNNLAGRVLDARREPGTVRSRQASPSALVTLSAGASAPSSTPADTTNAATNATATAIVVARNASDAALALSRNFSVDANTVARINVSQNPAYAAAVAAYASMATWRGPQAEVIPPDIPDRVPPVTAARRGGVIDEYV